MGRSPTRSPLPGSPPPHMYFVEVLRITLEPFGTERFQMKGFGAMSEPSRSATSRAHKSFG